MPSKQLQYKREKQDMQLQWISTKNQKPGVGMGLIDENWVIENVSEKHGPRPRKPTPGEKGLNQDLGNQVLEDNANQDLAKTKSWEKMNQDLAKTKSWEKMNQDLENQVLEKNLDQDL